MNETRHQLFLWRIDGHPPSVPLHYVQMCHVSYGTVWRWLSHMSGSVALTTTATGATWQTEEHGLHCYQAATCPAYFTAEAWAALPRGVPHLVVQPPWDGLKGEGPRWGELPAQLHVTPDHLWWSYTDPADGRRYTTVRLNRGTVVQWARQLWEVQERGDRRVADCVGGLGGATCQREGDDRMTDDSFPNVWPDPTLTMLDWPQFEAVWQCIKSWDINVPDAYAGYCGATGNHVRAILDALAPYLVRVDQLTLRPDPSSVLVVTLSAGQADHIYVQLVESLRALFAHGPEWHDVRIPVVFLEDGMTLVQMDEDAMRRAGWVRVPPEETTR